MGLGFKSARKDRSYAAKCECSDTLRSVLGCLRIRSGMLPWLSKVALETGHNETYGFIGIGFVVGRNRWRLRMTRRVAPSGVWHINPTASEQGRL